jgi:hypothetical protein
VIDCPHCDTPIDDGLDICPYCEEPLESAEPTDVSQRRQVVVTVNLKKGNPISEVALARLDVVLATNRVKHTDALRLIHGYGSGGLGGIIRNVVRERLEHLKYEREIRDFIPGEELGQADPSRFQTSFRPETADFGNPGITIVIL